MIHINRCCFLENMAKTSLIFFFVLISLGNGQFLAHKRFNRGAISSHLAHQQKQSQSESFTPAPVAPYRDVCAENAICVTPVQCPAHVRADYKKFCSVVGGRKGVCCNTGQNHTGNWYNYLFIWLVFVTTAFASKLFFVYRGYCERNFRSI